MSNQIEAIGFSFRQVSGPRVKDVSVNDDPNRTPSGPVGIVVDLFDVEKDRVLITSETFPNYAAADAGVERMLMRFDNALPQPRLNTEHERRTRRILN